MLSISLVLVYLVGLFFINQPPTDDHNWRQTLTLMIARNFMEPDANIFFPKYDIGKTPGIMSTEFPFYNYVLSFFYKVLGYNEWVGRWLNWTVTFTGFWFFYKTMKRFKGEWMGLFSALFLMFSVVLVYARKTMPDTFALSLVLIGVYYAWIYLEEMRKRDLILGFVFLTLGFLNKISFIPPAMILLIPFFEVRNPLRGKINFAGLMIVTLGMIGFWYGYWMDYLLETYQNRLIWPTTLSDGWQVFIKNTQAHLNIFQDVVYRNATSYYLALAGIVAAIFSRDVKYLIAFISYSFVTFLFILKTAGTFHTHEYYVILYVPMMAMNIGYLFNKLIGDKQKPIMVYALFLVALVLAFFPLRRVYEDYQYGQTHNYHITLKPIVDKYIGPADSVMVNSFLNPSLAYFSGRKAWSVRNDVIGKTEWMSDFKRQGLKLIIVDKHTFPESDTLPYLLLYEDEHFRLFKP